MNVSIMGAHGVGKTTTITELLKLPEVSLFEGVGDDHGNPIADNVPMRQLWRLGKYISDYTEAAVTDTNPLHLRLIDRCPYDWEAYTATFWRKEHRHIYDKLFTLYDNIKLLLPEYAIFIHPPYEWVVDRIKSRWNDEKQKWNEGDFEYLLQLRKQYERIVATAENTQFLVVTTTDKQERVDQITDWFKGINKAWGANLSVMELEGVK